LAQRGGAGLGIRRDVRAQYDALSGLNAECTIDVIEGAEMAFAWLPPVGRSIRVVRLHGGHHFFSDAEGRPRKALRAWAERRSLARADVICAVSEHVARETSRLVGLNSRPIEILPNPIDVRGFVPNTAREQSGRVLFVGTICEKKGVRELLAAFALVAAAIPQSRLFLVGRDSRDPISGGSYVDERRRELPAWLASRITFTGPVAHDKIAEHLSQASVCVFPSHAESFGIALVEAMAMERACVASSTGPGPEVLVDGVSGLHAHPDSPADIARAVVTLLRDDALRYRLAAAARLRVLQRFDASVIGPRNESFYLRAVATSRA